MRPGPSAARKGLDQSCSDTEEEQTSREWGKGEKKMSEETGVVVLKTGNKAWGSCCDEK